MSKSKSKPDYRKSVGLIDIYPSLSSDTINGKPLNEGVCFMGMHAGTGSVKHKGKQVEFTLMSGMDGATILLANNRYAKIDIRRMVDEAIAAGWLEETLDFKEAQ